jgi:hypothetical protein
MLAQMENIYEASVISVRSFSSDIEAAIIQLDTIRSVEAVPDDYRTKFDQLYAQFTDLAQQLKNIGTLK